MVEEHMRQTACQAANAMEQKGAFGVSFCKLYVLALERRFLTRSTRVAIPI